MFHTLLTEEYLHAQNMGLSETELLGLVADSFTFSFLPESERASLLLRPA